MANKTREWINARNKLKKKFAEMGITSCEIRWGGCWNDRALGFAHTLKRRNVTDINRVVLACNSCHQLVEAMTEKQMEKFLENIIANRQEEIIYGKHA